MTRNILAGLALAVMLALPVAGAWSKDDKAFLREAVQGNLAKVSLGRLAQQRSRNDSVREFGKMLADDHTAANRRAREVARQIGLRPPTKASMTQRLAFGFYAVLRGATFDRQFVRHMIDDHKKDIQAYEEQARGGGPVAEFAKDTLPTLRKHLSAVEDLLGRVTAQTR
jgi:putative membrane protein